MSETRSIIESSISSIREDSPADGGPEPADTGSESVELGGDTPEPVASGDDEGDTGEIAAPAAPVAEVKPPEPEPENDDFDKEPEFTTDARGRKTANRIPHTRVAVMVKKAVEKAQAALQPKLQEYEARVNQFEGLGQIMATDADRFMSMLAQAYPAYAKYTQPQPAAAPAAHAEDDPEPGPDGELSDGTPAYTVEGFRKREEWKERQLTKKIEGQWAQKYGWLDKERQAREAQEAAIPQVRAQMDTAMRSWDGFQANFNDILAELQRDSAESLTRGLPPQLSLHDAYRVVMHRKHTAEVEELKKAAESLKTDRNKLRAEILAELKQTPTSTAANPGVPAPAPIPVPVNEDGETSTKALIRRAIAGIKAA